MVVLDEDFAARAVAEKDTGNAHYKKKDFEKALASYNRAIELDPTNITFYTNKAAVFFEQGEHERCRETCLKAVDVGRTYKSDCKLIAKAYGRIGNSFFKQKNFEDARVFFCKSLSEIETQEAKEKLQLCEKETKEQERLAYINPDVSQKEKCKGDDAFKIGDFQSAMKHYTEAIRRNPDDAKLYLNRATVQMRLSMHKEALIDCEKAIKKDPNFVKVHICKGAALECLEKYDSAMDAYNKALDLDPNTKEATEAYYRCLDKDYRRRNNPASISERAMENEEIEAILSNCDVKNLIGEINHDPSLISKYLSDPLMMDNLRKLIKHNLINLR